MVPLGIVIAIMVLASIATPVAVDTVAGDSIYPNNPLAYFVERLGEEIKLVFIWNSTDKARILTKILEERYREVEYCNKTGKGLDEALRRFEEFEDRLADELIKLNETNPEAYKKVWKFIERQSELKRRILEGVLDKLLEKSRHIPIPVKR